MNIILYVEHLNFYSYEEINPKTYRVGRNIRAQTCLAVKKVRVNESQKLF